MGDWGEWKENRNMGKFEVELFFKIILALSYEAISAYRSYECIQCFVLWENQFVKSSPSSEWTVYKLLRMPLDVSIST